MKTPSRCPMRRVCARRLFREYALLAACSCFLYVIALSTTALSCTLVKDLASFIDWTSLRILALTTASSAGDFFSFINHLCHKFVLLIESIHSSKSGAPLMLSGLTHFSGGYSKDTLYVPFNQLKPTKAKAPTMENTSHRRLKPL